MQATKTIIWPILGGFLISASLSSKILIVNVKALYLTKHLAMACFTIINICFSLRVTAFAPQDHTKELVTLRKPTVHKVTMSTVRVTVQT